MDFILASWDQRYSGFSKFEIPEQPLTMTVASNTEDCNTIVNFLKEKFPQKKIVIWGQSWGGAIVSSYASHPTYNNKIAGWIVVNGTVTGFEWHRSCWEFAVRRCKEVDSIQYKESLDWLRANPFEPSKPFDRAHLLKVIEIASGLYYEGEPEQTDAQLEEVVKRIKTFFPLAADMDRYSRNVALEVNDISTSAEMYTWRVNVSAMSAPGLLIWGEKDETCPIELLNWYSNLLTSNQKIHDVKIYSNAWHTPFYSDPEKHDADVKQFINGLQ
ncbi:MAG: alpha/beta fold hydrolase [Chryseotalea sp.]